MLNSIEARIRKILLDDFRIPQDSVGPDTTLEELGFDSLIITELALVLDNEFGTAIEDGELSGTMTTGEAARLISLKGAAA